MCGLVAVIGPAGEQLFNTFELLLSTAITRGPDSTGVAGVADNKTKIVKDVMFPLELIRSPNYNKLIVSQLGKTNYLLGHCRFQTRGLISQPNAHPFKHEHITLMHNGTLDRHIEHKGAHTNTDSESICIGIAEKGIDKVWLELEGAASLIYYDEKEKSLFCITNGKRPLVIAGSADGKYAFFASEPWQIRGAVQQRGMKLYKDMIYSPSDNELWRFWWDGAKVDEDFEKLTPRPYVYVAKENKETQGQGNFSKLATAIQNMGRKSSTIGKTITPNMAAVGNKTPAPKLISEKEFNQRYNYCRLCWNSLYGEYTTAHIIDEEIAVCLDCTNTAKSNQMLLTSQSIRGM